MSRDKILGTASQSIDDPRQEITELLHDKQFTKLRVERYDERKNCWHCYIGTDVKVMILVHRQFYLSLFAVQKGQRVTVLDVPLICIQKGRSFMNPQ